MAGTPSTNDEYYRGESMTTFSKDELRKIAETDDLHISPFREDGLTYGTPTWIWSVAVDDALFVRAYNGPNSRWYQAAVQQKAGRIISAGMTKEVTFEPVVAPIPPRDQGHAFTLLSESVYSPDYPGGFRLHLARRFAGSLPVGAGALVEI
jgi:hypothetical protein